MTPKPEKKETTMNPPTTADTIDGPHDLDENRRCPHCGKTYPAIQIEADGKDWHLK